ncbi:MAG: DUF1192 family protein [Alphaproteobacteria bacterium]|nr:DUF1192 family protein [Alphaproteobacteria bacterium]
MIEDDRPKPPPPLALDGLSVDELEARIARLKGEIAQCEELVARKKAHRSAADGLFGGPPTS